MSDITENTGSDQTKGDLTEKSSDLSDDTEYYHPRATKTLFIGNIPSGFTKDVLKAKFEKFGEIVSIDIKTHSHQCYAFIGFTSITSTIAASREMDGQQFSGCVLKAGFAKSYPGNGVCLFDKSDRRGRFNDDGALEMVQKYGNVKNYVASRDGKTAVVIFEKAEDAREAVEDLSWFRVQKKVQADFASEDFQEVFLSKRGKDFRLE